MSTKAVGGSQFFSVLRDSENSLRITDLSKGSNIHKKVRGQKVHTIIARTERKLKQSRRREVLEETN